MKKFYFFIDKNNNTHGPVQLSYFQAYGINPRTPVWFEGLPGWVDASTVHELQKYLRDNGVETMASHNYPRETSYKYESVHKTPPAERASESVNRNAMMPKTWLFESILVTIFCCLPFGIAGIVNASRVQSLWAAGNFAASVEASQQAKNWTKWGMVIAVAVWLIYVLIALLVPASRDSIWFFNENI